MQTLWVAIEKGRNSTDLVVLNFGMFAATAIFGWALCQGMTLVVPHKLF
jgi:hypothetical protein